MQWNKIIFCQSNSFGSWIEFSTDINSVMYAYIDRKKKLPVTTLFRAGFERDKDILEILTLLRKLKFLKQDLKNISVEN
jgi:DNA-directed RNA polymerase subunit beta